MLTAATVTGCTDSGFVSEHPVKNELPALKPGVYSLQAVEIKPVATKEVEPNYPPELGSILSGQATVVFTVRADGKVADASVVQADDVLFGEAAVAAVNKWRFNPAQLNGAPVACRLSLPFAFTSPYGYPLWGDMPGKPLNAPPPDSPRSTSIDSR